jgi:hypothetical protein
MRIGRRYYVDPRDFDQGGFANENPHTAGKPAG